MNALTANMQRVFLALWPDDRVRSELADLVSACAAQVDGRPVAREKIHMTLVFLGALSETEIAAVNNCVDGLPDLYADLSLDRLGFWRHNGIVWAGCRHTEPGLQAFVGDLRERLARLGFRVERRAFSSHVTLLRRARNRPRLPAPRIDWPVTGIELVRSHLQPTGSEYEVLRRWGA